MLRTHQTFKEGRKRVTIQYMPARESVIDATVNGVPARRTVRVDGKTAARLQEDLEAAHARSAAGKAAAPCGYFDHRSGKGKTTCMTRYALDARCKRVRLGFCYFVIRDAPFFFLTLGLAVAGGGQFANSGAEVGAGGGENGGVVRV